MLTDKMCYRLSKTHRAHMEDPMTEAMGAGEFVSQFFADRCRRLRIDPMEVWERGEAYAMQRQARRMRHKNPVMLEWKEKQSFKRQVIAHEQEFYA